MSSRKRHNHHLPSPTFDFGRADNRVFGIVSAFHDDVGSQQLHQIERSVVRKNYYQIDAFERSENVGSLSIAANWTVRTLETADRLVAINANDQRISGRSRSAENIDMSWVKQVEDTISERDLALSRRPPALCVYPRRNFAGWIAWLQSLLAAVGVKCSTRCLLKGSLMTSS